MALPGGISAVNRSLVPVLAEFCASRGAPLTVLSLVESDLDRPPELPAAARFWGARRSKGRLFARLLREAPGRPVFLYERVGLATPTVPLAGVGAARVLLFAHGWENWRNVRLRDRWAIRSAELVITNSAYTLRRMQEAGTPFRGVACPLGLPAQVPLAPVAPREPSEPIELTAADGQARRLGPKSMLLVGRIDSTERLKGHTQLIRILPALRRKHPAAQFVFAGPGDDHAHLAALARGMGVGDAVFLPGEVSSLILAGLYHACVAYVMPSRQEGFGLAYLEAMNFAKPCIGTWNDGAEDVIEDGRTGYLVRDPEDQTELSGLIERLLDDPAHARVLGLAGFQRLQARFTAEAFRERILALLEREV